MIKQRMSSLRRTLRRERHPARRPHESLDVCPKQGGDIPDEPSDQNGRVGRPNRANKLISRVTPLALQQEVTSSVERGTLHASLPGTLDIAHLIRSEAERGRVIAYEGPSELGGGPHC